MSESRDRKSELRRKAEMLYSTRRSGATAGTKNTRDLVHELEVHQLELEMQNEELRRTQAKLEVALTRFEDLFDLAPVGYLTLQSTGTVVEANLTIASLLETSREALSHTNFTRFVSPEFQDVLLRHMHTTFEGEGHHTCELDLIRRDGDIFNAQLQSVVQNPGTDSEPRCLTVITDVTERRRQETVIYRQANYDPLTELPNRSLFADRLSYTLRTSQRERTGLASISTVRGSPNRVLG